MTANHKKNKGNPTPPKVLITIFGITIKYIRKGRLTQIGSLKDRKE